MIKCCYDRAKRTMTIEGHSNYAPTGYDIVCAGITALEIALDSYLQGRADCITRMEPSSSLFVGNDETLPAMDCIWSGIVLISSNYPNFCKCGFSVDKPI